MKSKVCQWGNSHAVRLSGDVMSHLNVEPGEDLELVLTSKGIEILKNSCSIENLETVTEQALSSLLNKSDPVRTVQDPYAKTDVAYIVVPINPCDPLIREVPVGTEGAFNTLAEAKEQARQILQSAISEAQKSLSTLRQLGIDNIGYISL